MLQEFETDPSESEPALETHPPQVTKAAALTGALVQRGRDRAPRLPAVPVPVLEAEPEPVFPSAPVSDEVPLVFARPPRKAAAPARASRWSEALFVAACCAAFFATFLFVLRF